MKTAWHQDARWRLVAGVIFGAAASLPFFAYDQPTLALLVGWSVAALAYCLVTWVSIGRMDAKQTASHATREIPGGLAVHILLILAALASLVGIGYLIFRPPGSRILSAGICLGVIVASWMTVHTLHALRYAREYYRSGTGIDFHSAEDPRYMDFAYLAFTVGMSFAVSDTDLTSSTMRRIGLFHALLAYLFGTVFVAALVNILVSLWG